MPHRFAASIAFLLLATVVTACASAARSTASGAVDEDSGRCALRQQDSIFVAGGPVYRLCAVTKKAVFLTPDIRPDFRPSDTSNNCYSADVEFVVDARGIPETRTARIGQTNNQAFAESVLAVLPRWRFEPAQLEGVPVRQIMNVRQAVGIAVSVVSGSMPSAPPRSARPRC